MREQTYYQPMQHILHIQTITTICMSAIDFDTHSIPNEKTAETIRRHNYHTKHMQTVTNACTKCCGTSSPIASTRS